MTWHPKFTPQIFHEHHAAEVEDIAFWSDLAKNQQGMSLELGCGTGRILVQLAQMGQRVIGLDLDFESLIFLHGQLSPQLASWVDVFVADMKAFHLDRKFGFIYLACNTLSTLTNDMRRQVYTRVNDHLAENGIFATSIPNPILLEELPELGESIVEDIIAHPTTGDPIQVSNSWKKSQKQIVFYWHYDRLSPDGQVERNTIESKHFIESPEEYLRELRSANLIPVETFGNFDKSAFDVDSPYLIMLGRKNARDIR